MRQTEDAGRQSNVSQLCCELKQHKFKLINTLEIEGKEKQKLKRCFIITIE